MKQNLKTTVTNILNKRVTEEQTLQWVNNNFGEFCTYIVNQRLDRLGITKKETTFKLHGRNKIRIQKK